MMMQSRSREGLAVNPVLGFRLACGKPGYICRCGQCASDVSPNPERAHGLKYSLFYGRQGTRLVGYDNERGKGDHRHIGRREYSYRFVTIEKLVADFLADVAKARGET